MKLITQKIRTALLRNYRQRHQDGYDPIPPLKLFYPAGPQTWIITEMDPELPDRLFGLCDLGFGHPETGWVSLQELASFRGALKIRGHINRVVRGIIRIERDRWFSTKKPFSYFIGTAREAGRIKD